MARNKNLFEAEDLNDKFNLAMTKRGKEIVDNLAFVYGDCYAEKYGTVFNNFLSRVFIADLLDGV
jgi:hypothetical protein